MLELFSAVGKQCVRDLHKLGRQRPQSLFHYTSGLGLHGILSTHTLLGGNYSFLNDASEIEYGQNLLRAVISDRLSHCSATNARSLLELAFAFPGFEQMDLYMTCFCKTPDLLSQWRGYGTKDSRYCVEFEPSHLAQAVSVASPLMRVVYHEAEQKRLLGKVIDDHLTAIDSILEDAKNYDAGEVLETGARCLHASSMVYLGFVKNPSFREEQEWRVVHAAPYSRQTPQLSFVSGGSVLKPFMVLLKGGQPDIFSRSTQTEDQIRKVDRPLPITRIIVGASSFERQAVKSAHLMLDKYGYKNVPVGVSEVPLQG